MRVAARPRCAVRSAGGRHEMSETPARPQRASQLLDAYYGKAGASRVILPSQEIYRFAAYVASELFRLRAECDEWKKVSGCDTPEGPRALMEAAAEAQRRWRSCSRKPKPSVTACEMRWRR